MSVKSEMYTRLLKSLDDVRKKTDFIPETALVLGSGLGGFADECVEKITEIPYSEISGFPVSTIAGHKGRFVLGLLGGVRVAVMQGRVHYYEGYGMDEVVMPIRLMKLMGADKLVLTNASGGINSSFEVGGLMLVTDHISSLVPSPLRGENIDELGTRFPDMTAVYDKALCETVRRTAKDIGCTLFEGTYIQVPGPNFETPAEITMYRTLGADAVGMSTACEAMAAHHAGMRVCAVSCIANMAAGMGKKNLCHEDVQAAAAKASQSFKKLISGTVTGINKVMPF